MKEKKERESWRVSRIAYVIAIAWAVFCLIMATVGFNVGFPDGVSMMFLFLTGIPLVAVAIVESKRKKKFDAEEARKAAEIRQRYDAEQRERRLEEYRREQEHEAQAIYRTTTKVVGITFKNETGLKRQDVLANMYETNTITLEKYFFKGKEPACRVIDDVSGEDFGNLSAELVSDLAWKYPKTKWEARINSLDSFWPEDKNKEIHLCKIDLFIFKADDDDDEEIF